MVPNIVVLNCEDKKAPNRTPKQFWNCWVKPQDPQIAKWIHCSDSEEAGGGGCFAPMFLLYSKKNSG